MPGDVSGSGIAVNAFSKSCSPRREDVIVKAESCGGLSKKQQQQCFGLCDLYIQASLELWVSFQGTTADKEPT